MRYIFNVPFALLIKHHDLFYDKKLGSINILCVFQQISSIRFSVFPGFQICG